MRLRPSDDRPLLLGVLHLAALPGAPSPSPGLEDVETRALADARALAEGGVDGLILENFGDAPFSAGAVEPYIVAAMTRIALAVRAAVPDLLLGVNVLRNDARAALGIATAVGAAFIRVNVHVGAMVTDQGLVTGTARDTLLERRRLGSEVAIAADLLVKHAAPLGAVSVEQAARDTWTRGRADALIVTGSGTGQPFDPMDVDRVRRCVPAAPIWAGSGLDPDSARAFAAVLDGAIVGTWFHRDGDLTAPVEPDRVRALRDAFRRG